MYYRRVTVLFTVIFNLVCCLLFIYIYIAEHEFTTIPRHSGTNKYIDVDVKKHKADEIQEFYTKDYSIPEIEARVQKERARIDQHLSGKNRRKLSDVVLVGVFKAGTGTLSLWLRSHPQIVQVKNISGYSEHSYSYFEHMARMPNISKGQIIYERCTDCFTQQAARERIHAAYPHRAVKLLIMIRDPIVRLVSEYIQRAFLKDKQISFEEYISTSDGTTEIEICHKCVHTSVYVSHFAKWLMLFPRANIHLIDSDIFIQTPWKELEKIEQFLQIDHFFSEDRFPPNPKKPNFRCFIKDYESEPHCMGEGKGRSHPNITAETLLKLKKYFKPYNEQLFTLAGQRFSWSVNYN